MLHEEKEEEAQQQFLLMRKTATGLFVFMAIIFFLANHFQSSSPFVLWIRAFCEAAMIGALADWYAITALFKQPLGLAIPHTAIIPNSKNRIASSLGSLAQQKLLPAEGVTKLLDHWDIPSVVISKLLDAQERDAIVDTLAERIRIFIQATEDERLRKQFYDLLVKLTSGLPFSRVIGQILCSLVRGSERDHLIDEGLMALKKYLSRNKSKWSEELAKGSPWYKKWLKERSIEKVLDKIVAAINEIKSDHDLLFRKNVIEDFVKFALWLRSSDKAREREAEIKAKLMGNGPLLNYLDESWQYLKEKILNDLQSETSAIRSYIRVVLESLGDSLKNDPESCAVFKENIQKAVYGLAKANEGKIKELIENTVKEWPTEQLIKTIQLHVGKDLQFIRINGTIVGGLVGVLLYAAVLILG